MTAKGLSLRGAQRRSNPDDKEAQRSIAFRTLVRRRGRCLLGAALAAVLAIAGAPRAHCEEVTALYQAYWAGVPAGEIRLKLRDDPAGYRDEITVRSQGLPWLLTHFRA